METPPTPETTISAFVGAWMALTALSVVLTLLVIRRRQQLAGKLAFGLATTAILAAAGVYLILPPHAQSDQASAGERCPYDRLVWSNMRSGLPERWRPCREAARAELALMLLAASVATVGAAVTVQELLPSRAADETDSPGLALP